MPSLDGKTVEFRYTFDNHEAGVDFILAIDDMMWVGMPPPIPPEQIDTPEKAELVDAARFLFENRGLALVACRVAERQPDFVIVEVPALPQVQRLRVKPGSVARRV